ncbi:MAG: hypothetical protein AABX03_01960, partial [Nanoarchaeota archaeon]
MNKNKIAGSYSLVISIIGISASLLYSIFYLSLGKFNVSEGFGVLVLIYTIPIFLISLLLIFSSFAIIKNKKWGKIVALVVFILFTLLFTLMSYASLGAIYAP